MTVVADLVARLRTETDQFDAGMKQSEQVVHSLGSSIEGEGEKLGRFKEMAGTVALGVGASFTAMAVAMAQSTSTFTQQTEQWTSQFSALLGSTGAALNQTSMIRDFANQFGLADQQVAGMSVTLQSLTHGTQNNVASFERLANVAVVTGQSVSSLGNQFGYMYQLLQDGVPVSYVARQLVRMGAITEQTVMQLQNMSRQGAGPDQIWSALMSSLDKFNGAADQAKNNFVNLKQSIKNMFEEDVGTVFAPLVSGIEHVMKALKDLMSSEIVKTFVEHLSTDVSHLTGGFDRLANSVGGLSSSFSVGGLDALIRNVKDAGPLVATLTGLFAEFGAEIVGELPIINRFAGPVVGMLEDGRGAILGLVLSSREARDALLNLGEAALNLVSGVGGMASSFSTLLSTIGPLLALMLNFTAAVVDFAATHRELVNVGIAIIAVYEGFKLLDGGVTLLREIIVGVKAFVTGIETMIQSFGKKKEAELEGDAITKKQLTSTQELTAAMKELAVSFQTAAEARVQLNQAEGVGSTMDELAATRATNSAQSVMNLYDKSGPAAFGGRNFGGAALGAGFVGGALYGIGASTGNTGLEAGGSILSGVGGGAFIGSMFGGGPGAIIGGVIGGIAGLAQALNILGDSADSAQSKIDAVNNVLGSFDKKNPQDVTDVNDLQRRSQAAQDQLLNPGAEKQNITQQFADLLKSVYGANADAKLHGSPMDAAKELLGHSTNSDWHFDFAGFGAVDAASAQTLFDRYKNVSIAGSDPKLQSAATDAKKDADNAMTNAKVIADVTGESLDKVIAKAKELKLDLTFDPGDGSSKSTDALKQLLSGLSEIDAKQQALAQSAQQITDHYDRMKSALQGIYGTGGAMGIGGVAQSNKFTLNEDVKSFDPRVQTGMTVDTVGYAQEKLAEFERATGGVTRAQRDLRVAEEQLHRTQQDLDNEVTKATEIMQRYQSGNRDLNADYIDTATLLSRLGPEYAELGNQYATLVGQVKQLQDQYDSLNTTYQNEQDQLQLLTDKEKAYQDILNIRLEGTSKYDKAIQANKMSQESIQLMIAQLESTGMSSEDPRIKQLTAQLNILKNAGEQLNLQKDLDIGDKKFQLDQLSQGLKEIDYETAKKAAQEVGNLKDQITDLTSKSDAEKEALDRAKQAYDRSKTAADALHGSLSQIAGDEFNIAAQMRGVVDASNAVTSAVLSANLALSQSVQNAIDVTKNAAIENANAAIYAMTVISNKAQIEMLQYEMYQAQIALTAGKQTDVPFLTLQQIIGNIMWYLQHPDQIPASGIDYSQAISTAHADGGIEHFASGGMYENHLAQIARGGRTRIWNEPETGGEAYIPMGLNKRSSALDVLGQVMNEFGVPGAGPMLVHAGDHSVHVAEGAVMIDIVATSNMSAEEIAAEVADRVDDAFDQIVQTLRAR